MSPLEYKLQHLLIKYVKASQEQNKPLHGLYKVVMDILTSDDGVIILNKKDKGLKLLENGKKRKK